MTGFGDYQVALKSRDVLVRMMEGVVERLRPDARIGQVISKDVNTQTCHVLFAGDETPLKVTYHRHQEPPRTTEANGSGSIVRVAGRLGSYYLVGVLDKDGADKWTVPTFQNSWVNYDLGYAQAAYMKRDGIVYLRGTVKSGTLNLPVFTLPAGFRPAAHLAFPAMIYSATTTSGAASAGTAHTHPVTPLITATQLEVRSNGEVRTNVVAGSNLYLSLDSVRFFAEA